MAMVFANIVRVLACLVVMMGIWAAIGTVGAAAADTPSDPATSDSSSTPSSDSEGVADDDAETNAESELDTDPADEPTVTETNPSESEAIENEQDSASTVTDPVDPIVPDVPAVDSDTEPSEPALPAQSGSPDDRDEATESPESSASPESFASPESPAASAPSEPARPEFVAPEEPPVVDVVSSTTAADVAQIAYVEITDSAPTSVATAAADATPASAAVHAVTTVLSWFGLDDQMGGLTPSAVDSPFAWAVAAWVRRTQEQLAPYLEPVVTPLNDLAADTVFGVLREVSKLPYGPELIRGVYEIQHAAFMSWYDSPIGEFTDAVGITATRTFTVVNTTAEDLLFEEYWVYQGDIIDGPVPGTVLRPGESVDMTMTYWFAGGNRVAALYSNVENRQSYVTHWSNEMEINSFTGVGKVSCSAARACAVDQNSLTMFMLDLPGTTIVLDATDDAQAQEAYEQLDKLCYTGSAANCAFVVDRYFDASAPTHKVGGSVWNDSSTEVTTTVSITDTVSTTQGGTTELTTEANFLIVKAAIKQQYNYNVVQTNTFRQDITVKVPPGHVATVYATQPVERYYGTFTINIGNTTIILRNVYFDIPDANGSSDYKVESVPATVATSLDE